jgi:hypothetical protein
MENTITVTQAKQVLKMWDTNVDNLCKWMMF